jgi:iron-sulfur cluster assembly protein
MAAKDENLDDVIASLIDEEPEQESTTEEKFRKQFEELSKGENVKLTERAAKQVRKIKLDENLDDELYLRVAVEGGGCSGLSYKLGFDIRTDEDELVETQGMEVIVKPDHMLYLDGVVIDYPDGLDARGFTFENPNASEACGCGSSFAV